jgi:hypothetical protein
MSGCDDDLAFRRIAQEQAWEHVYHTRRISNGHPTITLRQGVSVIGRDLLSQKGSYLEWLFLPTYLSVLAASTFPISIQHCTFLHRLYSMVNTNEPALQQHVTALNIHGPSAYPDPFLARRRDRWVHKDFSFVYGVQVREAYTEISCLARGEKYIAWRATRDVCRQNLEQIAIHAALHDPPEIVPILPNSQCTVSSTIHPGQSNRPAT